MKKSTFLRSLILCGLSMCLCISMLAGSTFAWFTDEVKSGNNIIMAGNLDVELTHTNKTVTDETVAGATNLFSDIDAKKWEPNAMAMETFTVKNLGNLALKYELSLNVSDVTTGKDGTSFATALMVAVVNGTVAGRAAAEAIAESEWKTLESISKVGDLMPTENGVTDEDVWTVIIWWKPSDNDNNFNMNNGATDEMSATIGVRLFATQVEAEDDSFGKDYDADAPIVSAPVARPTTGITLKGAEDVTIGLPEDVVENLPAGVTEIGLSVSEPVVDATAKTITFASIELVDQNGDVIDLEALNTNTNITVTLPAQTTFAPGETVVLYHDGEYVATAVVNADTTISYKVAHLCEVSVGAVEVPAEEDGVVKIANAAQLFGFAQSVNAGNYYAGKNVVLTADIDLKNAEWTPIGSATADHGFMGNFDGNGYAIKNLSITNIAIDADGYAYAGFFGVTEGEAGAENVIKNLVIENVTINTKGHIVAAAIAYPYYTTLENITVRGDIAIKGGNYTAGVLAYTRRCTTASNISICGYDGSYITGATTVGGVISDIQMNGGLTANYSNFSASNITVTGDKAVGGIAGIIGSQTLNYATVENVKLVCSNAHVGIIAGSYDGKPVINNATYSNVTGTAAIVGAPYGEGSHRNVIIDGVEYVGVKTADELVEALEANNNVIFLCDIKIDPANMSNAYGKTGINVKNGQTIDGNGYTLDIKGAGGTWDSGINTTGGIIKNITVTGSFRGIFVNHNSTHSETVVLENVTLTGVVYTISCDQGMNQGLVATNCTFNGWTSFATTLGNAKFVDCSFGKGNGYAYCRPYAPTELVDCDFAEGYTLNPVAAVILEDCTLAGEDVTTENVVDLVTGTDNVTVK